jgi:hypothetical protein
MKITDPDVIKNGEKDLIEAVTDDLDLDAVKDILQERMAAAALSSTGGEIVVHNNEIAFRLDFDIQLSGSLMFDRQGTYIPESVETGDEEPNGLDAPDDQENIMSEDFDLEDIDISETLEEVGPQTLLDDSEDDDSEDTTDGLEELTDEPGSELEIEEDGLEELMDDPGSDLGIGEDDLISDDIVDDDIVDDDISDILEESRDFWEPKKDT